MTKNPVRTRSTCVSVCIPSTCSVSTRCFRAPVLIGFRPVCVVPSASHTALLRVNIGQVLISMRCRDQVGKFALEALRRAKYKIAGRQKIYTSRKWGFTKDLKQDFMEGRKAGRILKDGIGCQYDNGHGPLKAWIRRQ